MGLPLRSGAQSFLSLKHLAHLSGGGPYPTVILHICSELGTELAQAPHQIEDLLQVFICCM